MKLLSLALLTGLAGPSRAALVAYWNFNDLSNPGTPSNANVTSYLPTQGTGSIALTGWTSRGGATTPHGITNFAGSTVNALGVDPAGQALALTGGTTSISNNGAVLTIAFSMTNLEDPVLTFAGQRSGTGFSSDQVAWSTDGTTFTNFGTPINLPTTFALQTVNLSTVNDLDNVATAYLRITFSGATNASGNNRFDNIQINAADIIPEPCGMLLAGAAAAIGGMRRNRRRP